MRRMSGWSRPAARMLSRGGALFSRLGWRWGLGALAALLVVFGALGMYWSGEPEPLSVDYTDERPVGYATTDTLIRTVRALLDKPGGYLHNDIAPPGVLMDNIPSFEKGAVIQARDLARSLRNDMGRSQSQSREDPDLARAEPLFNYSYDRWLWPSTESRYRDAIEALVSYRERLVESADQQTQFYARADNLRSYLQVVEKRLGSLSLRLAASVGRLRVNTDLAGDPAARQSTPAAAEIPEETPWLEVDDVFYEARGSAWALLNFLRAIRIDFDSVLRDKNAVVSLRQVIRELEASQRPLWSPVVLNGGGFGIFANHSLVMASYLSRANAAIIDLRELLAQG